MAGHPSPDPSSNSASPEPATVEMTPSGPTRRTRPLPGVGDVIAAARGREHVGRAGQLRRRGGTAVPGGATLHRSGESGDDAVTVHATDLLPVREHDAAVRHAREALGEPYVGRFGGAALATPLFL